jgi:hypothetical protein
MFINTVPVGKTFTSAEYISAIGHKENVTRWKRISKNTHYNCHQYKGYLKRVGFISSVKRGTWKVDRHIPEWFDHGHLSILLGYYKRDSKNHCDIKTYKGMNRTDILAQLDEDAHRAMGLLIPTPKKENSLPKLYSTNRKVYEKFISYIIETGKRSFRSQTELYIALEKIKFPWIKNNAKTNRHGGVNYEPVIMHLMNDGILTFDGYSNNRKEFTVHLPAIEYDVKTTAKTVEKIIPENKNYIQPENKIDNTTGLRVESNSTTQPIISETKKTLHSPDTQELSKNIALLEAAFNLVGDCSTPDRFMQARLYNIQVLIQDITSAFSEKKDFLTNN